MLTREAYEKLAGLPGCTVQGTRIEWCYHGKRPELPRGMQCTEYLCPRNLPQLIKHKGERSGRRPQAAPSVAAEGCELRANFLLRLRK